MLVCLGGLGNPLLYRCQQQFLSFGRSQRAQVNCSEARCNIPSDLILTKHFGHLTVFNTSTETFCHHKRIKGQYLAAPKPG